MSGSAIFEPEETNSGTVTSWIPLTTSFSAEPACSKAIYLQRLGNFVAFDPFYVSLSADSTRCLPFEGTLWWNQAGTALNNVGLRQTSSIGPVACPAAFTTAFTLEFSDSSTKVACCPSDYAFQGTILEKGQIRQ
ncbi:hypothetical protein B0O99DRAFT_680907 [Bisporella sp. PMI_857]|nr:hypothetical protein B0O99DRAFT_680907 [Bisporella sp. PMI_857]